MTRPPIHIAFAAFVLTGCAGGCGASQADSALAVDYATVIARCDAREERIVDQAAFREDAEEQLELERARCAEEKRAWREAHGVQVGFSQAEEVERGE